MSRSSTCESGRNVSAMSPSGQGITLAAETASNTKLSWVSITPLGSAVVPEV